MIYDYKYLQNLSYEDKKVPLERYLYKFSFHRTEIKKLKTHEKDFLFEHMYLLEDENKQKIFDLTSISEASEYYFKRLILIYSENLNFNKPTKNHLGKIIDNLTMEKDKNYFNNYYKIWQIQLKEKKASI